MPLFEIGYRRYEGQRISHGMHWWPITRTGLAIAWRSKLLRRLVYVSYLPFLYFAFIFFIIGRVTDPSIEASSPWYEVARGMLGPGLVEQMRSDPALIRSTLWAAIFGSFGGSVQLLFAGLVAAIVGPPLVANDLRSRAFLIYFARPISRLDYVLGKAGVLLVLLGAVTLMPSLALYVLSILFSPSLGTIAQTLPVVGTIVLASLGTMIPVALILLVLSSITRQARFATLAWFVLCLFGPLTHIFLSLTSGLRDNGWTFMLSLVHTLRSFQFGLYDVGGRVDQLKVSRDVSELADGLVASDSPLRAGIWLAVISIACVFILLRRVDAPTRV